MRLLSSFIQMYCLVIPNNNNNNQNNVVSIQKRQTKLLLASSSNNKQQRYGQKKQQPAVSDTDMDIDDYSVRKRFYVDGNNLMGHKGTPKTRTDIADKLKSVQRAEIVLVFDGTKIKKINENNDSTNEQKELQVQQSQQKVETEIITYNELFSQINLGDGLLADDYIIEEISKLTTTIYKSKIEIVTADRLLRKQVLEIKPIVNGVINPQVFWKRYRPRLTGLKSNYINVPYTPEY